jgi:hypothetical protein
MAKNDVVLLDGIIDERVAESAPSGKRDEVFEFFCFEQILKDYDLSRDEIESGWVDGRDDGGIDGVFTFVNGHLLRDPADFSWPKTHAEITTLVVTCKHHDTFQQAPLNALHASVSELFNLAADRKDLVGAYSDALLDARGIFHTAYRKLAAVRPTVSIQFAYLSRGDTAAVEPNVRARAEQVVETTRPLFSSSECGFRFVGAAELVAMYRRAKKFAIELPALEFLSRGQSGYIVLADLCAYADFVTDDNGQLRRYLFDSNVRDFLGRTQVNEDILSSLRGPSSPDFWWLNNGVTILATDATVVGKTLHLRDIQIVNGLQTTESIHRHFRSGAGGDGRSLLVKVIVSTDVTHRDRIIQATNNQNQVETAGLRATDKVQRDIEEYLDRHGWYYERRRNYFKNVGKPPDRFVTPMYLAAGYVALVMRNPGAARKLKGKFMRKERAYAAVFSDRTPIRTWVVITEVLKRTETLLQPLRPPGGGGRERFLAGWRNAVAVIAVARVLGRYSYSTPELLAFDSRAITDASVREIWEVVMSQPGQTRIAVGGRNASFVLDCCQRAAAEFGIEDVEVLGRRHLPPELPAKEVTQKKKLKRREVRLTDDLLDRVDAALPAQPWKPGVHRVVASKLGCEVVEVSAAINRLMELGRRNNQRDGVVYAPDGSVLVVDHDRASAPDEK